MPGHYLTIHVIHVMSLISFEDLKYLGYCSFLRWEGALSRLLQADTTAIPDDEEEVQKHQHCSLFVVTTRDAQGRYKVDHVTFSFSNEDEDGEEEVESWDRSNGPLRHHLDQIVDDYFEDSNPGERAIARERIEQVSKQCHDFTHVSSTQ